MDVTIEPHPLSGTVPAVASKSVAHRLLILAALADGTTDIDCNTTSRDIDATARCLEALGARIARTRRGFRVRPIPRDADGAPLAASGATLDCGESGSTLRFMLPVAAALGRPCALDGHGFPRRAFCRFASRETLPAARSTSQATSPPSTCPASSWRLRSFRAACACA